MVEFNLPAGTEDALLLLIRLVVGFSFIVAARNKSRNIRKFAKNNDVSVPVAMVVMTVEFIAGLALLLGIWPQVAALALMLLMLGTMRMHIFKWRSPYWANKGGWEYDLMLFAMAAVIVVFGGGQLSLLG